MNTRAILAYYDLLSYGYGGDEVTFCCPFHGEQTPSLSFNTQKNVFYCFSCEASGDCIDLVRSLEGYSSDMQAIRKIAKILRSPDAASHLRVVPQERESYQAAREKAFTFYKSLPAIDWLKIASSYLYERGFTSQTLTQCGVKYNANSIYALVIPLVEQGVFYGYVTRRIDQVKSRKYLNNRGYPRSEILIGNLVPDRVLVVDGILDRMKAVQYGVTNATALLNWKISDVQARKLAAVATTVVCGLDNDEKGERGYEYLCAVMRPYGVPVVRLPFPPEKKDVCDLSRKEFLLGWRATIFQENKNLVQKVL